MMQLQIKQMQTQTDSLSSGGGGGGGDPDGAGTARYLINQFQKRIQLLYIRICRNWYLYVSFN